MKIIKTAQEVNSFRTQRELANIGCKTCPCCGESMSTWEAIENDLYPHRGISSVAVTRIIKGSWFSMEYKNVDVYSCRRCGAEWESEPY